jgi:hypothetical protein
MDARDSAEIAWEAPSFLASSAEEQVQLLGPAGEWFVREDSNSNPGANYIRGVANIFLEYENAFMDSADILDVTTSTALRDKLWEIPAKAWSKESLRIDPNWEDVRKIARKLLAEANLEPNPPTKPIWIPDFLEVEHYSVEDDRD